MREAVRAAVLAAMCGVMIAGSAPRAGADVIWGAVPMVSGSVTAGTTISDHDFPQLRWSVSGADFSFVGGFSGDSGARVDCGPCAAGETLALSSRFSGSSLGNGSAAVGTFGPDQRDFEDVWWSGELNFAGGNVTLPDRTGLVTLTAPFTFTADNLRGWRDREQTDLMFEAGLTGRGTATLTLNGFHDPSNGTLYDFRSIRYDFAGPGGPSQTPEPASMLLLGSGLAGIVARRRRQAGK